MATKKKALLNFTCPFCHSVIKSSSKTDIYYRNQWIKGCYSCFASSIDEKTTLIFQEER